MTIQAYVDETGLDGKSPCFLFSALTATIGDWAEFSDRWKAVLDEHPRIAYFKMAEAAGFNGPFYGWSESARNLKLMRLAQTFRDAEYGFLEFSVSADLGAIEQKLRPISIKPANEPYFWSFHITIQSIGWALIDTSPDYDIPYEVYFDEHVVFGPRAKAWYPVIRAMAEPKLKALMPVEPFFRDDKKTMPLQAADLTAWMSRRDKEGDNKFEWLKEHLVGLSRPPSLSVHFGSREIELLHDKTPIPPEFRWKVDAARRAFNETFIEGGAKHYVPKPKHKPKERKT